MIVARAFYGPISTASPGAIVSSCRTIAGIRARISSMRLRILTNVITAIPMSGKFC